MSQTARSVLDRASTQMAMIHTLRGTLVNRELPDLGWTTSEDQRTAWIRDVIQSCCIGGLKVRQSKPETWEQAFKRVCGEEL